MRRSTAGKRKTRERDSAEGRSTRQRSRDINEPSMSFFFGELNTNASFAGSARCTENPLFLRSLYLKEVECSSAISGFMEEYFYTNVFHSSSPFSISFFNGAILLHLCHIYHRFDIHSYRHIGHLEVVVRA
jgi:hypothetical protein